MSNLLLTKLYRPSIPPKRVPRPHLMQQLDEGLASGRQITLVSAPAGFGKTICISEWVNGLDDPVTWLSLDPADNDPGRFFVYLIAALQKVDETLGREIEGILRAGQLPPRDIVTTTLINDILAVENRFLLVLDDAQLIEDRFILHVLRNLVTNLPPPLHLVLLTREDPPLPLARLRANNRMTEIRAADLRFSGRETSQFLNGMMDLSLSQADIKALAEKTEGWVVGLQLAALAMQSPLPVRDRADLSTFIATLSGSHRHILGYLTEEVLNRQSEEIKDFLLQTSILDKLSGALCNAVTGRSDSHFLLERLFNANLFLIPLDDERQWYRYHHLFAGSLRNLQNMLQKEQTADLHRRASHWYARAGLEQHPAFAIEAIQHALAAEDYALAVRLIESHAMEMIMQWYVKTVKEWIQRLPPEWSAQSPKTSLAFAWTHLWHGDFTQAAPYLERLEEMFSGSQMTDDPALQGEWLALQSTLLNAQGKPAQSLEVGRQALALVPEQEGYVRGLIYMGLAGAYQQMEEYDQTVAAYQQLIQYGRAAGSLVSQLLGISGLALLALHHGQLHFAYELASQGAELIAQSGSLPPISTAIYGELGEVHYQWHQLEEANTYFLRAIQVSTLSGYSDAELYHGVVRSRLLQIEGDLEAAAQAIQKAVDLMQAVGPVAVREEVISQQVRVYLAQNRLAAAEAVLQEHGFFFQDAVSMPDLAPKRSVTPQVGRLYSSALRILLHRAQTKHDLAGLEQGIAVAGRLLAGALQDQYIPIALGALLLRAQMYTVLENEQDGLADVARALELAEPEGFISVFVEEGSPIAEALATLLDRRQLGTVQPGYVKKILAAFPENIQSPGSPFSSPPTAVVEELIEPLSKRELQILRLIREGYSNQEIAERLVITLHTVKKHNSNIYSKLGVSSRTQAVARARQLQLL